MDKKNCIVIDKFLPKEQRGNMKKPEWMEHLLEYMTEVAEELKVSLSAETEPETFAKLTNKKLRSEIICKIIGKDVTPVSLVEFKPGDELKITVTLKQGKNMPKEITLVHTTIL
ncbi:MAG: hypothetical protein MJZ82_03905 [Paludibacteraceae bacterium]|nr:hypothetical protein [Paludibacteraceae bacterium]